MSSTAAPPRGALIRDLLTFSLKLWVEGFKDIVLMPLAWIGAGIDFFFRTRFFYRVLRFGESFDHRLDLFSAARRVEQGEGSSFAANRAGDPTRTGRLRKESFDV